ncbi:SDR family NAD(P)-dependent oxidoreductase [Colwellia demingiae]|uniref:SDR family NAD(P)-dependent oxidoreductase n=1 Tax=Colwellia demingiae TaxID=89401 RepID=A0A5C6Q5F2_9GAMM|nr:SDR family NAD(P)-dependent oxidoreductase [Colwellia demingiae]TWX64155.1 SDR family NAD(P)-dependent oxidoreductase [Colwellia demingiae]
MSNYQDKLNMHFKGKVAVITGAASGIGKALAIKLAEQGCNLALVDRDIQGLMSVQAELQSYSITCVIEDLDVSDKQGFVDFSETVIAQFSRVDMLFNNAGVSLIDSVENQSFEDFHWLMNINFWGVVYGSHAFLPYLKKSPNAHLVNVSSLFGLLSLPLQSAYNSSKFAVRGFTESLKMEMAGTNVSVHCVHPGGIKTNITNNAKISTEHVPKSQILSDFNKQAKTTAEQAADVILQGLINNKRRILIGNDAKLLDRIVRWFPATYEKVLGFEKGVLAKRQKQ